MENANERLGVPPHHVTDYLAMVGDSSDNVPGVKGIGDKTACELVSTYGSLENILEHVSEITKKRPREALLAHEAEARLSKSLVTIREDLDMPLELETLALAEPDHAQLRDLFVELEFHALAKDHAVSAPVIARETNYVTVDTMEALDTLLQRVRAGTVHRGRHGDGHRAWQSTDRRSTSIDTRVDLDRRRTRRGVLPAAQASGATKRPG